MDISKQQSREKFQIALSTMIKLNKGQEVFMIVLLRIYECFGYNIGNIDEVVKIE